MALKKITGGGGGVGGGGGGRGIDVKEILIITRNVELHFRWIPRISIMIWKNNIE